MNDTIQITRGASVAFDLRWLRSKTIPPAAPDPIDLTPYNVEVSFAHPQLQGHLAMTVSDAPAGRATGVLTWVADMPLGRVMHFNARLVPKPGNPGLLPIASPRIWFEVIE